ncbi:MAG: hypothetical protein ACE37K_11345 [Planctomycetota bacterium]
MRGLLWLPLLALTAGCWQPRYFAPRENLTGTSPEGRGAAVYQVERDEDARTRGEVRIWSDGAQARFTDDDQEVVDLHVAFEVENNGEVPLELDVDSIRVEELFVDGYLKDPLLPQAVAGRPRAEPGTTTRVDLVFRPPTTYPSDVDSFDVRFAVRDGVGAVGQVTPFAPAQQLRGRYRDRYWNDPFWGGGFWGPGWGWGYGWGAGWGYGFRCR